MTDKDIIFRILTKEELAVAAPESYSYMGWEGGGAMAFYLFAENYHMAAQALYDKMVASGRRNDVLDGLVYPLIFTHRQFVELMLKGIYLEFSNGTEEDVKQMLNKTGHDLRQAWSYVKPLLSSGKKHVGSGVNLGALEHYIKEINVYDPDSMAMRYPVNKKLDKMREGSMHFDYHLFHNRMNDLYHALNQIKHDLTGQLTVNHDENEISAFRAIVDTNRSKLDKLMDILRPMVKKEEEDMEARLSGKSFAGLCVGDDGDFEQPERPDLDYILSNGDDFLILVETLYYCGRHTAEKIVTLSKDKDERRKEFVCLCLDDMENNGFSFGKAPNKANINIHSKIPSAILDQLSRALEILY